MLFRILLLILLTCFSAKVFCQPDVDFHVNLHLFPGKKIIKVKRDFYDPYVWALGQHNEVYRVNSITLEVNDLTALFSSFSTLEFIDIAGRSRDTCFLATRSAGIIQFIKGDLKFLGSASGIKDTVTSVGVDYSRRLQGVFYDKYGNVLLVGTQKGLYRYNMKTEKAILSSDTLYSRVFEATYRQDSFSGFNFNGFPSDTTTYFPFESNTPLTIFGQFAWLGGKYFGKQLNTAFYVPGAYNDYTRSTLSSIFWGTETGMSQVNRDDSYWTMFPSAHYLNNIKVNKITDIFGLTSFGQLGWFVITGLIKQNLLIGTDKGLYYSSSIFDNYDPDPAHNGLRLVSLFHNDEIGNVVINDISVNPISINFPHICENGAWIAANDGLYFIKPDYAAHLISPQLLSVHFRDQPDTLQNFHLCAGNSVTAFIDTVQYTSNTVQWYKNGKELPGESKDSLVISSPGDYSALLYDPCENIHVQSNHLKVGVLNGPVFSFNYPALIRQCGTTPYIFQTNGSPGYRYRWYTNGTLNGDTTNFFSAVQSGKYKVEVSACNNSWVPSNEVSLELITMPVPMITQDKPDYCTGEIATLSAGLPVDTSYTLNWYKDNALLTGTTNKTSITTGNAGSYTVQLTAHHPASDGTLCRQISPEQVLAFSPPPVVSIKKITNTTLCQGQSVGLLAHYSSGTPKWSTGETTDEIQVTTAGRYGLTITTPGGCKTDTAITITFNPNPVISLKDTSVCIYNRQGITVSGPPGFVTYAWNGVPGNQYYHVNSPQTLSLTVTDSNGCQATKSIAITNGCEDIIIPNTFSPNNDGINDRWNIEGLNDHPQVNVRVFNRYGAKVFESTGYGTPWNGEVAGKKVTAGTYYYIITVAGTKKTYSGPLTVID